MTRYLSLAEYFWLAEQVTGVDADTLAEYPRSAHFERLWHAALGEDHGCVISEI